MKIKVVKERSGAILPTKKNPEDAGWDVYSCEDVKIDSHSRKLVEIGVRIKAPQGYYYTFAPRSGHAFKSNVIPSHHNVMDSGYTGSCAVLMYNRSDDSYLIHKGERFCQIVFYRVPSFVIEEVSDEEFYNITSNRGGEGFGSSGR